MPQKQPARQADFKISRGFDRQAVNKICTERGWVLCGPFDLNILAGTQHCKDSRRVYQYNSYRKVVDHVLFCVDAKTGKPAALLSAPYWTLKCDGDAHVAAEKCSEACGLAVVAIPKAIYMVGQLPTQTFILTKKVA